MIETDTECVADGQAALSSEWVDGYLHIHKHAQSSCLSYVSMEKWEARTQGHQPQAIVTAPLPSASNIQGKIPMRSDSLLGLGGHILLFDSSMNGTVQEADWRYSE